ncbi:MAG: envelope stress response membrane protein PspB [Hyphomonadaceae bacterium]|jgi:phage shock protein B
MNPEAFMGMSLGLVAIVSLFVVLPWMILHYISKNRSSRNLTEDEERMLEDLWRSARTMERRIETLERLLEPDAAPIRPRPTQSTRGDIN